MRTIYIGSGQRTKKNDGSNWKIYFFLFLLLAIVSSALKVTAPFIVEKWLNQHGEGGNGYAYMIRDVEFNFGKGQIVLKDVKMFNPKTSNALLEASNLTIELNLQEFILSQNKMVSVFADKIDLFLSKDFSSEIERIKAADKNLDKDFYLNAVEGKIGHLNIIEKKEDQSRTMLELKDVNVSVKELTLLSINKKTSFGLTSTIADGGKLSITGKISEEASWSLNGSLKQVPAEIFNKIAGDKLPFSFNESKLNAEITAHSDHGMVSGEITPDIKRLNLIEEKPGIPTQLTARALTDELTFTLPFTLKDGLTLQYEDTFRKLKTYRKYVAVAETSRPQEVAIPKIVKTKKSTSFWPF